MNNFLNKYVRIPGFLHTICILALPDQGIRLIVIIRNYARIGVGIKSNSDLGLKFLSGIKLRSSQRGKTRHEITKKTA